MHMEFTSHGIVVERNLSDLDTFTLDFIASLPIECVIVSGYVSILLGRARVSEDIDCLIEPQEPENIIKAHDALVAAGFYCLNTEDIKEMISMLNDGLAVRYAKMDTVIPNMEMKFARKPIEQAAINDAIVVNLGNRSLRISPLELQIVVKEEYLKSPKDMEDALHLREIAKSHINPEKMQYYRRLLHEQEAKPARTR